MDIQPADRRGLTEIVGLSVSTFAIVVAIIVERNNPVALQPLIALLIAIVGILIARSTKGAQDRTAAVEKYDAAASAVMRVTSELRTALAQHQGWIAALASVAQKEGIPIPGLPPPPTSTPTPPPAPTTDDKKGA